MTRRETILKLIVQHFVKTAEPVASKTLIEKYGLNFSSATIRAEMNALEKDGFIEKPHASAGRVPSKKGYQYFVEHLNNRPIEDEVKFRLQTIMDKKVASVENVIKESCEILAEMTNLVSVVTNPKGNEERLMKIEMFPISGNSATAVFVTNQGYVENKTFIFKNKVSVDDITQCVKLLNDRLVGTPINDLVPKMEAIKPILANYVIEHDVIYQAILETFLRFASERVTLFGKEELLNQPEFKDDAEKLKQIIELLDNPARLTEKINSVNIDNKAQDDSARVRVHIADKKSDHNDDMSVVSASINLGDTSKGTISLLGPSRMDYDRVVSLLDYVVKNINRYLNLVEDRNNERGKSEAKGREEGSQSKRKPQKRNRKS